MPASLPLPLTAVVLTFNEERNLPACVDSLSNWTAAMFVVDSGSGDRTVAIARERGAIVVTHPFETHARQWNWALRSLPVETEWVMCVDADQRVTPELRDSIQSAFANGAAALTDVDGLYVTRRQIFRGRWIRHGGYYPKHLLKLVRHRSAWCDENERLDFRFYVRGRTMTLDGDLIEDNRNEADLAFWLTKHVRFARLQADEEMERRSSSPPWAVKPSLFGTPDARTLWLKSRWYRLPLYARPLLYFTYRYFFRLGFLDGKQGFVFHVLQAFWYRLIVDVMLDDARHADAAALQRVASVHETLVATERGPIP